MNSPGRKDSSLPPDPLWYKDAVIYQLHVKSFFDSNSDGIGDFKGLTAKLDYLKDLGVTALWLLPFYPSPLRDDGYDIADYRGIHPSYGTMADFRTFVRAAHHRGLRVITELVINHTSDQHPWFQRARRAKPGSNWRNYYVWSDSDTRYAGTRIIFLDTEKSNWTWDAEAKAYYWHRFYSHQPDLNFDHPAVFREVVRVMRFWLDCGVDGLRLDAVPYLFEREGTNNENLPETHELLKRLRAEVDRAYQDKMLLAEANQWPEDVLPYFGNGDECHMAFHFPLMPRIYMALAQEDRHPITDIMRQTPDIPAGAQWAIFLRNHDELTLEMVTDRERDYLWAFYAGNPRARLNLGIRRRLSPLVENDRERIDLLNSLLLSMPGTPVLYYGDEIGMGDNVYLGDRDGVRTPMQWSPDRNAGFSHADPARLFLPPIMDAIYGYQAVNVEAQTTLGTSLLNQMRRLLSLRSARRTFGRGTLTFLYPRNRKVLAYLRRHEDDIVLCVANLSRGSQPVELELGEFKGRIPVELFDRSQFPAIAERPYLLTLHGHSFYWFSLLQPAKIEGALAGAGTDSAPELMTLVLREGWNDLKAGRGAGDLLRESLLRFMPTQRWFGAKDKHIREVRLGGAATLVSAPSPGPSADSGGGWRVLLADARLSDGTTQRYLIPLGLLWGAPTAEPLIGLLPQTVAYVRKTRSEGALFDASSHDGFVRAAFRAMTRNENFPGEEGVLRFHATSALASHPPPAELTVRRVGGEQSNSSAMVDDYAIFKLYRRLQAGIHPETEIMGYLTEKAPSVSIPALLGTVEWIDAGGEPTVLGLAMSFVRNQGDAWTYTLDHLKRSFLDAAHNAAPEPHSGSQPATPAAAAAAAAAAGAGAGATAVAATEAASGTAAAASPAEPKPAPMNPGPPPSPGNRLSTPNVEVPHPQHGLYVAIATRLGQRTAELHRALCQLGETDPAFRPEPITESDLKEWTSEIVAQAVQEFDAIKAWAAAHPDTDKETLELIRRVLALRSALRERTDRITVDRVAGMKTRYHGDLHLGQVLVNQSDVVIIDFEGEPRRSMKERRRKHTPLKDVAGILRSFDYAAAAAGRTIAELPALQLEDFQKFCDEWRAHSVGAFMSAYRETIGDCPVWPENREAAADLLDLLILDKAIYEIGYELANRPSWLSIPLRAVVNLLGGAEAPKESPKKQ